MLHLVDFSQGISRFVQVSLACATRSCTGGRGGTSQWLWPGNSEQPGHRYVLADIEKMSLFFSYRKFLRLKGQCHKIMGFFFGFFHESVSPKPLSILLWPFQIFSKIKKGDFFFFFLLYVRYSTLPHLPPLRFPVSEDAGIEPRTVATLALTARRSIHSARSHLFS